MTIIVDQNQITLLLDDDDRVIDSIEDIKHHVVDYLSPRKDGPFKVL